MNVEYPIYRISVLIVMTAVIATTAGRLPERLATAASQDEDSSRSDSDNTVTTEKTDTKSLIQEAFKGTKSAKTVAEFQSVIQTCGRLLEQDLSESNRNYIKRLKAWNHNKRGELYAEQATEAAEQEHADADEAKELDEQALAEFNAAIDLDDTRWKSYHNRGVSLALFGKYDEALRDFDKTIEMKPQYANAWFNRAEIAYESEEYVRAIRDYSEVIRLKPNDADAHSRRAHSRYRLRQFREAISDYNQAVRLDSNNSDVFADRADAHAHLGEWDGAAQDYKNAIHLDQSNARAYQGAAWLMATCPDSQYRDSERALETAQKAISLTPGADYRYLDTLAAAYAAVGDYDNALVAVQKAIQLAAEEEVTQDDVKKLERRFELYKIRQPFRQALRPIEGATQ